MTTAPTITSLSPCRPRPTTEEIRTAVARAFGREPKESDLERAARACGRDFTQAGREHA